MNHFKTKTALLGMRSDPKGHTFKYDFMFFSHLTFFYNECILFVKNNDSNKVTSMADFSKNELFF